MQLQTGSKGRPVKLSTWAAVSIAVAAAAFAYVVIVGGPKVTYESDMVRDMRKK